MRLRPGVVGGGRRRVGSGGVFMSPRGRPRSPLPNYTAVKVIKDSRSFYTDLEEARAKLRGAPKCEMSMNFL